MPSLPDTWEVKDLARNWLPLELLNISVFIHEEASESLDHNAGCVAVWEGRKINFHTKPVNFWLEPDLHVSRYSHVGNTFCKNFFFFFPSQAGQVQSLPPTGMWARREGECSSCLSSWPICADEHVLSCSWFDFSRNENHGTWQDTRVCFHEPCDSKQWDPRL